MFFPAMERTKDRRGTAPVSAFAERALTVTFPPVPLSTGACPFGCYKLSGGLNFDRAPFYSRPTGAFFHQNLVVLHSNAHRLVRPYLFGAAVVGQMPATAQLPRLFLSRRCHFSCISSRFLLCRPQWAEARRTQGLVFGAAGRKCLSSRMASPRNGGLGVGRLGTPACSEAFLGDTPPVTLWFLSGDPEWNPPRRAEPCLNIRKS